ncbi:hypothetical protein LXT21_24630 [Myxococcus sp. K38C18041901]|uniref:hypothetical protein n=1 Tax=Myxococcus guangdongensis TaxID=2906760 RepID=UPI0020A83391|nr:hypothetical protein [Myxococcus guangdongensis]MCP3061974.1 hypothetical protein [Myxococcus guangdongensis]
MSPPWIQSTVRAVMGMTLSILACPSLAEDAGSGVEPVGFECPVQTGGTKHLLRVAISNPLSYDSRQPTVRILSPRLRELWASARWPVTQLECAPGGLTLKLESAPVRFSLIEDGERLSLDTEVREIRREAEKGSSRAPGSFTKQAAELSRRAHALTDVAHAFVDSQWDFVRPLLEEVDDLWTRELWWSQGGGWPVTGSRPSEDGGFSNTPRGARLTQEVNRFRARSAPLYFGAPRSIGATPIGDLSDLVWSDERPCVAQDAAGSSFRCYDAAKKAWGPKVPRPANGVSGTLISDEETSYRGHAVRIVTDGPSSDNYRSSCSVVDATREWQVFRLEGGNTGKTFCPMRASVSPSGTQGVALVRRFTLTEEIMGYPNVRGVITDKGYQLWLFTPGTP